MAITNPTNPVKVDCCDKVVMDARQKQLFVESFTDNTETKDQVATTINGNVTGTHIIDLTNTANVERSEMENLNPKLCSSLMESFDNEIIINLPINYKSP